MPPHQQPRSAAASSPSYGRCACNPARQSREQTALTTMCTVGAFEPVQGAISPPSGVPSGSVNDAVNVTPPLHNARVRRQRKGRQKGAGGQCAARAERGDSQHMRCSCSRLTAAALPYSTAAARRICRSTSLPPRPSALAPTAATAGRLAPQQHVRAVAGSAKVRHPVHSYAVVLVPHLHRSCTALCQQARHAHRKH